MNFRRATINDIPAIVNMLADDKLGRERENLQRPLAEAYALAFRKIDTDKNQELMLIENENNQILGTFQLTYIQYLTYQGGKRAQIEAVRIRKDKRGIGLGKTMFKWAINKAKERNAHLLQLTTDKKRPDALRFYENLGFNASHEGMKLHFKAI